MTSLRIPFLMITILLFLFSGCSKNQKQIPVDKGVWLACIDADTIFTSDFLNRYESTPHFGQGLQGASGYLKAMIVEKLLAEYGLQNNDQKRFSKYEKFAHQLNDEILVENLLLQEVNKSISISEDEIQEHYERLAETLTLSALVVIDSASAYSIRNALETTSLETVVNQNRRSIVNLVNEQPLSYNQSEPEFERIAYSLEPGSYSNPINSSGYWWIIKLIRKDNNRIISDEDLEKNREYLASVIKTRKMKIKQSEFIKYSMVGKKVDIDEVAFNLLLTKLGEVYSMIQSDNQQTKMIASKNFEIRDGIQFDKNMNLMELKGFSKSNYTIEEAFLWFSMSPRNVLFEQNPKFADNVYKELLYMTEFLALKEMAIKNNIASDIRVKDDVNLWENHIYGQYGMTLVSLETGEKMAVDQQKSSEELDMTVADSLMLSRILSFAYKHTIRFNWGALAKLDLDVAPVFLKKTHYPNRPLAPMPIGYRWAILWEPESNE